MNWLAETSMLAHGWKRALILVLAGALAGLSVPPLFLLPVLFVSFPVWIWCLDGAEHRAGWRSLFGPAFSIGFMFGLGYFLVAIHWVGAAFFVDGGWFLTLMPLAVLTLAAVLALFWGLASAVAHYFWSDGVWRVVALTFALSLAEFARGHLFTGFPFDLVGYALTANVQMAQLSAVIGIYGLTALAIFLAMLPALIWPTDGRSLTRRLVPFFSLLVILAAQLGYGNYRLQVTPLIPRTDIKLRLIQPAIQQAQKWQSDSREFVMQRLLTLSETKLTPDDPGLFGITHLIWPESAMPFYLADQPDDLARIARMLPLGKNLITGAPRKEYGPEAPEQAFNAILMINSEGEVVASYDKTHLVPIGEYLPFRGFFRSLGLTQFVPGAIGWTHGDARRLIDVAGTPPFLPLVCYEAIFSGGLGDVVSGADFILNLTNDGWFDGSIGPAQHFYHTRVRAIEEGRALVRVANTGITALVDPLGRIEASVSQGQVGLIDVVPQRPLPPTPFARFRHWPFFLVMLATFGMLGWRKRANTRENRAR